MQARPWSAPVQRHANSAVVSNLRRFLNARTVREPNMGRHVGPSQGRTSTRSPHGWPGVTATVLDFAVLGLTHLPAIVVPALRTVAGTLPSDH